MKKFFKGLLTVISVIILIGCALLIYLLVTSDGDITEIFSTSSGDSYSEIQQTGGESSDIPEETSGGNAGEMQYNYYKVTVSEDRYYIESDELDLDTLIGSISALDDSYIVEIIDNNATLKAYKALTDMLDEKSVPYTENDGEIHT